MYGADAVAERLRSITAHANDVRRARQNRQLINWIHLE